VAARLRVAIRSRDEGRDLIAEGRAPTVAVRLEYWLDNVAAGRVRPSTLDTYRAYVRHRVIQGLGRHRLDRLAPEHVEAFYAGLLAEGLAPATVLQIHRILSRALKVAMQRGKVHRNVATLVDAPSVSRPEVQPLTAEECRAVLALAAGRRNAARWSVALALGLRQGEALGLMWDAVDLEAGTITVRQALQRRRGGGLVLVPPKSRAGRRTVPLPSPLRAALLAHRLVQLGEREVAGSMWVETGLVFATATGKPVDPRADHREWKELLAAAGVRPARLHDARHTAATLLLMQGVPARVVMEILGHSQITLTLGTYSHVAPEVSRSAMDRLSPVLWDEDA
jgi:integrase